MKLSILGSGSRGNAFLLRAEREAILIDLGFGTLTLKNRLQALGESLEGLCGIFLSHEHIDHIRGLKSIARHFSVPIFATEGTWEGISSELPLNRVVIKAGEKIFLNGFTVQAFRVPHDAREPVGFVIEGFGHCLALATDLGSTNFLVKQRLKEAQVIVLESNHDPEMLKQGPYPWELKQRILSRFGHLSNQDCGKVLSELGTGALEQVVLAHLSQTNNTPQLAYQTVREYLEERVSLKVSSQDLPGPVIELK